jgi:hypothetical protein
MMDSGLLKSDQDASFYPNNVTRQEMWYSRQWSTNCRLVDEDDGQKEGSFDRLIGLVYCGNDNINDKKITK